MQGPIINPSQAQNQRLQLAQALCTGLSVLCTLHFVVCTAQCAVISVVDNVQFFFLCSELCTMFSVQCAVFSLVLRYAGVLRDGVRGVGKPGVSIHHKAQGAGAREEPLGMGMQGPRGWST